MLSPSPRVALLLLACGLSAGCRRHAEETAGADAGGSAPTEASAPAPRRPSRRYYLANLASHCEVYRVDEMDVTEPVPTPCPQDLKPGERIRIAGMTCTRESEERERQVPVVCPDPLTNQEKRDRAAAVP
jgi:hypothetical protein